MRLTGPEDGVGFDEVGLGGEELVGVVQEGLNGFAADDARGAGAIDVDGGRGFEDRSKPVRKD